MSFQIIAKIIQNNNHVAALMFQETQQMDTFKV